MRVVGEAAASIEVLRGAVTGDPDQMQVQRLAECVQALHEDRLDADAVVGAGRLEETVFA